MICEPCNAAGNQAREVVSQPARRGAASHQLDMAMEGHGKCRGGTWCDCTHQPPHVRPEPTEPRAAGSD